MSGAGHPRALLAAYVNGTLAAGERRAIEEHVRACLACRDDVASWQALSGSARLAAQEAASVPVDAGELFERIRADIQAPAGQTLTRSLGHGLAVFRSQAPLVRAQIWAASALVMGLGFGVCLLQRGASIGLVFTLLVPMVAAAGIAFIYGPEIDPSLELALATPTSPRTVLLARLTLVFGFDLALAGLGSAVVAAAGLAPGGLGALISLWLGPMLLISAGSLLASLYLGGTSALMGAVVVWTVRTVAEFGGLDGSATALMTQLWSTGPLALGLAAGLFAVALVAGAGREHVA